MPAVLSPAVASRTENLEKNPEPAKELQCVLCKRLESEIFGSVKWFKTWKTLEVEKALCKYCFSDPNQYSISRLLDSNSDHDENNDDEDNCQESGFPVHFLKNTGSCKDLFGRNKIESKTFNLDTNRRFIGCEIEIDALDSPRFVDVFSEKVQQRVAFNNGVLWDNGALAVSDGSLSNNGFEICTFPANGDSFLTQIKNITSAINRQSPEINSNCGMHIHVDASDFEPRDICNFMKLYCMIENAVFETLPPSRRKNQYCQKICSNQSQVEFLFTKRVKSLEAAATTAYDFSKFRKFNKVALDRYKQDKKPGSRYKAVNLSSWFHQKTIEFRMFGGTTDYEKITTWCLFWANLLTLVKNTLYTPKRIYQYLGVFPKDASEVYNLSSEESWNCLMKVCSSDYQRKWFKTRRDKFLNASKNV